MPVVKVTVLYEDKLIRGPVTGFGPHALVLACVHDQIGGDLWGGLARAIEGQPKGGNSALLKACHRDRLSRFTSPVIAVFDDDQVRPLLQLPQDATKEVVVEQIRERCQLLDTPSFHVILLVRNLESILEAARDCGAVGDINEALSKNRGARDRVLTNIAYDPLKADLRACIQDKSPSLKSLVDLILFLL